MFGKIGYLRHGFHDAHRVLNGSRRQIRNTAGKQIGFIDRVRFEGGALRVSGWVTGVETVTLKFAGVSRATAPTLDRQDVAQDNGISPQVGFDLSIQCSAQHFAREVAPGIIFETRARETGIDPMTLPVTDSWAARRRVDLHFLARLLGILPTALRWLRSRSRKDRAAILAALSIGQSLPSAVVAENLFLPAPPTFAAPVPKVTIILPIYDAFELVKTCLECVVAHTDVPFRLILVDDASPDARVRPFLREWITRHDRVNATLVENDENLGFIGSVNKALRMACDPKDAARGASEGPIILLNSDAFVPANWVRRLIAPLQVDDNVASTTPMSNDAEIMSVPSICKAGKVTYEVARAVDATAALLDPDVAWANVPTGVGFCMALSRKWLAAVPQFDRVFGRGYGEEVDWCQRVRAKGGTHVAVGNLFVQHQGGASFDTASKRDLLTRNGGIISRRYPEFDGDVQAFISADPLQCARLALALSWAGAAAQSNVKVYLAHSLGGGAEDDLKSRVLDDLAYGGAAIVLRVGGPHAWRVEVHSPYGVVTGDTDDTDLLERLMSRVGQFDLVYSCGVGAVDPVELPNVMLALHRLGGGRLSVLIHDFFVMSPSYTLLGSDGRYCGPKLAGSQDPAHTWQAGDAAPVGIQAWQDGWLCLLRAADQIDVFSEDSCAILRDLWPDLADRMRVRPHVVATDISRVVAPIGPEVLGILGGINFAKGASVVAEFAKRNPARKIVIIGKVDPAFHMPPNVTVHGSYVRSDIASLAEHYGIGRWLIPSIWPETFSFTTHEALATGLPVIAFELGAQGSVVRKAKHGTALPFDAGQPFDPAKLAATVTDHLQQCGA